MHDDDPRVVKVMVVVVVVVVVWLVWCDGSSPERWGGDILHGDGGVLNGGECSGWCGGSRRGGGGSCGDGDGDGRWCVG